MTRSRLRVLTYHRVLPPGRALKAPSSVVSATPRAFRIQMGHLARRYRVVRMEEVLRAVRGGPPLPRRAVLITFDDAYADVGEVAWPILRALGLPATIFVPTAYPDRPDRQFWWERIHAAARGSSARSLRALPDGPLPFDGPATRLESLRFVRRRLKELPHDEAMRVVEEVCAELGEGAPRPARVLGWDELRTLASEGMTVAAHTRTHPALDRLDRDAARAEIRGSREDLCRELGSAPPVLAYPFGAHDAAAIESAREEGIELGFTCVEGHNLLPGADPLKLRRTGITSRTGSAVFRMRLQPWFPPVDRWRRAHPLPFRRASRRRIPAGR